ncbi:hypothetical protein AM571_CH02892 [Rhizobium etli 8C-3]|uniref:DUF1579 domain-containing protein n=2 Tax=Rhizobium TaxID=379 RepID=A0A1L5P6D0_RHIET|nr:MULTISPECIES: hypothetical protein [Rhizobium]APO75694.1 hypothetical protein AM571_CH02892 [Rhizobium etli 8C-3]TCU33387.1 hypothetical protein EV129_116146 [Rhizobium azibense]
MRCAVFSLSLALACSQPHAAAAQEADFLRSLSGNWQGTGQVLMRIGSDPVNVRCSFATRAGLANFSMNGSCRGFIVVRRAVSANLRVSGGRYSGTYVGPMGLPSALSGSRRGNAINLSVRWARPVNGDRNATMTIEKIGADGLRLLTVDRDHATGRSVITSNIDLRRQ